MLELTPHERRALRAQAHHLHPVVTIGQHGITPMVLTEIDLALNAHGLVKVRVFVDDRGTREAMFAEIADGLGAAPVQHIGKLFVLWRPQPEPEAAPAEAPRPQRGKAPAAKAPPGDRKPAATFAPVGRRARGQPRPGTGATVEDAARGRAAGAGRKAGVPSPRAPQVPPRARGHLDRDGGPAGAPEAGRMARGPSAPNPRRRRSAR